MTSTCVVSFEFFPPKKENAATKLEKTVSEIKRFQKEHDKDIVEFVSVTCGAGGGVADDFKGTLLHAEKIAKELEVESVAHITCVSTTREEVSTLLDELLSRGIKSLLVLRGDRRKDVDESWKPDFANATDLIEFISEKYARKFRIGVATYPEGHVESPEGIETDLKYLKLKQDLGAEFAVTQLFFDNDKFLEFCRRARELGVVIPIIPGILPATSVQVIKRSQNLSGCSIPDRLSQILKKEGQKDFKEEGYNFTLKQCLDLAERGVTHFHIFTLNNHTIPLRLAKELRQYKNTVEEKG